MSNDFKDIFSELRTQNWELEKTSRGHWKATPPDKSLAIVHFSESNDPHALRNTIRDLKRGGLIWPPPSKKDLASDRRTEAETEFVSPFERGEELAKRAGEELLALPSPSDSSRKEVREVDMDKLFQELKEARAYATLTEEHYAECAAKVKEAQLELQRAEAERASATKNLATKKQEFDEAFHSAA